jgi:hypothetical protein
VLSHGIEEYISTAVVLRSVVPMTMTANSRNSTVDVELAVACSHSNSDFSSPSSNSVAHALTAPHCKSRLADDVDWSTFLFFAVSGILCRRSVFFGLYSTLILLFLVARVFYAVYIYERTYNTIDGAFMFIAVACQVTAILACTYHNSRRLSSKYKNLEIAIHAKLTFRSLMTSVITAVISTIPILENVLREDFNEETVLYQITLDFAIVLVLCVIFGANTQFLLVDVVLAEMQVQKLIQQQLGGTNVTMNDLETIRQDIKLAEQEGFIVNTTLMSTALVNVAVAFAVFIVHPSSFSLCFSISFLLKEVILAFVGLYMTAVVNEANDELTTALSRALVRKQATDPSPGYSINPSDMPLRPYAEEEPIQKVDTKAVLVSLQAEPIKFSLLGMKLTRKDVIFRFMLWLFGILLSLAERAV